MPPIQNTTSQRDSPRKHHNHSMTNLRCWTTIFNSPSSSIYTSLGAFHIERSSSTTLDVIVCSHIQVMQHLLLSRSESITRRLPSVTRTFSHWITRRVQVHKSLPSRVPSLTPTLSLSLSLLFSSCGPLFMLTVSFQHISFARFYFLGELVQHDERSSD